MNYYVAATIDDLKGRPLEARDEMSFDGPSISSESDLPCLLEKDLVGRRTVGLITGGFTMQPAFSAIFSSRKWNVLSLSARAGGTFPRSLGTNRNTQVCGSDGRRICDPTRDRGRWNHAR